MVNVLVSTLGGAPSVLMVRENYLSGQPKRVTWVSSKQLLCLWEITLRAVWIVFPSMCLMQLDILVWLQIKNLLLINICCTHWQTCVVSLAFSIVCSGHIMQQSWKSIRADRSITSQHQTAFSSLNPFVHYVPLEVLQATWKITENNLSLATTAVWITDLY